MHGETPMEYQTVKEGWGWGNLYKWEKERRARRTEGQRQESAWRLWLSTEARLMGKNVVPALTGHGGSHRTQVLLERAMASVEDCNNH